MLTFRRRADEALRAGPGWKDTLFAVAYDDAGNLYDHIVPPHDVPNDESPCNLHEPQSGKPTQCSKTSRPFDFRRLGLRSTAMLISPWVAKGAVFQEPKGPTANSQWEHSSFPATAKTLFGLPGFLTKRDAWAGSFEELLLDEPRTDAPLHLPTAPEPVGPWVRPPPNMSSARRSLETGQAATPQHCSAATLPSGAGAPVSCPGARAMTTKQRRMLELYSQLTTTPTPDVAAMDYGNEHN